VERVNWDEYQRELKLVREFNWTRLVRCQACERKTRVRLSKQRGQRLRNRPCPHCGGRLRPISYARSLAKVKAR
jgi:hypothetical protein